MTHTRVTLTFNGRRARDESDRLLDRAQHRPDRAGAETVGVTQGSVHYTENMETTLTGLTPTR